MTLLDKLEVPDLSRKDTLAHSLVCYAANAVLGHGGQGEFLAQMVFALDKLPQGRILSRAAKAGRADCVTIPKTGWHMTGASAISRIPFARSKRDLLMLLNDLNFDSKLPAHLGNVDLFDGVMGQCAETMAWLHSRKVPTILTPLNTHIGNLAESMEEEYRRLNIPLPRYIHPGMQERVRREISCATRIRAVSQLVKASFVARGVKEEAIDVIPPAVDLQHFRPTPKQDDVFRVLAVSSIDPRKGLYYLLQAFEKAAIPHSELVLIGGTGDRWSKNMLGSFQARLRNLKTKFADVSQEPVESTYGMASVFVHPAIEDGWGLTVAQALACGKPVITTRQTGAAELITEGHNGYVLNCRDVDGLVDRLRTLAREESLSRRLSDAAPHSVAHLTYDAFAENVAQMYYRTLESDRAR